MTAGEVLAAVDTLRPNQYGATEKLAWLRQLDGKLYDELFWVYDGDLSGQPRTYTAKTMLLAPFPYDWALYTNWLFAQIDLHNAEIVKYNQSMTLFAAAWRELGDYWNRTHTPRTAPGWQF